jgi:hypothetical protein
MAYDSDRGVTVLFGGSLFTPADFFPLDETWEFDGTQWRRIIIDGTSPSKRTGGAMCYDTVRQEMVLFGGFNSRRLKDTWVYRSNGPGHGIWIQKADLNSGFP